MTIEEKLKQMIIAEYGSLRQFTIQHNLTYASIDSILRRGIKNATWTNVKNLCKALGISANELADEKIVIIEESETPSKDIEKILSMNRQNIQQLDDLLLDNKALTESELEVLLDSLEMGIEIIKRNRRRMMKND
jgi:predicted DNA binding protein